MKRSLLAAALLAATATTALAASANETVTLRKAGYWSAWYSPSNSGGNAMCGMGSRINYTSGADGLFMVKFSGDDVFVHIFKTSWKIPSGTKIPIWLKFDRGEPLTTTASGGSPEDGGIGGFVEFSIKPDFTKDFLGLFANANSMTLGFEQGSENPWAINMTGSREVAESFRKCSLELAQKPGSTQPYGNSGTTQPYGNKPARPSQPFGTQPTPKQQPRDDGGI